MLTQIAHSTVHGGPFGRAMSLDPIRTTRTQ